MNIRSLLFTLFTFTYGTVIVSAQKTIPGLLEKRVEEAELRTTEAQLNEAKTYNLHVAHLDRHAHEIKAILSNPDIKNHQLRAKFEKQQRSYDQQAQAAFKLHMLPAIEKRSEEETILSELKQILTCINRKSFPTIKDLDDCYTECTTSTEAKRNIMRARLMGSGSIEAIKRGSKRTEYTIKHMKSSLQ